MKKLVLICAAIAALSLVSCKKETGPKIVDVNVSFTSGNEVLVVEGIKINFKDANATEFSFVSDAQGKVLAQLPEGNYSWTAYGRVTKDGNVVKCNGASKAPLAVAVGMAPVSFELNVVASSPIIIKELYNGGFTSATEGKTKSGTDGYVVLYNNTAEAVDASDVVFCFGAPYNAGGNNKYYTDEKLLYENETWMPAYGAIWWFTGKVNIPAYSSLVVAVWGAIDHTKTYAESVDLSKAEYYWMSNEGLTQYNNAAYVCADAISKDHYLTCYPYTMGNKWALSIASPAFYIGKMDKAEADRISKDSENYDKTMGTSAAFACVKFPQASVLDAVEVFPESDVEGSHARIPSKINTGYVALTNYLGHTVYRNVDEEATKALPENEGKLVTGYKNDPSGIDAEASIKNGAHIIFMDTNNSSNDFHQREVASLK